MQEKYLRGAIQKEPGRLYPGSVSLLQEGCGIPFEPPTRHQRIVVIEDPPLRISTEKNGGLVEGVVRGKYDWAFAGEDMYEGLPDDQRDRVMIVRRLGFQFCEYRLGIWEGVPEKTLVARGKDTVRTLEDLKPGTAIATKRDHVNFLRRVITDRGLNLVAVLDSSPETAPELLGIFVVADNYETGGTWKNLRPHGISPKEVLLESQAVLIRAKRLPRGMGHIFNDKFLPRVDRALANPKLWLNPKPEPEYQEPPMSGNDRRGVLDEFTPSVRMVGGAVAVAS